MLEIAIVVGQEGILLELNSFPSFVCYYGIYYNALAKRQVGETSTTSDMQMIPL